MFERNGQKLGSVVHKTAGPSSDEAPKSESKSAPAKAPATKKTDASKSAPAKKAADPVPPAKADVKTEE
jgi:hypothetical protein